VLTGTRAQARSSATRPDERGRVSHVLARRSRFERLLLTLLLVERMTPAEAGATLGLPAEDVTRACDRLLAALRSPSPRRTRAATSRRKAA
jgi:DNA-directed RNA polymerase specialized sigma24 family protein